MGIFIPRTGQIHASDSHNGSFYPLYRHFSLLLI